jgi:hypothetical protein
MAAVRGGKVHPICVPPDLVWLHVAACTVEAVWLPCLSDGVVEIAEAVWLPCLSDGVVEIARGGDREGRR